MYSTTTAAMATRLLCVFLFVLVPNVIFSFPVGPIGTPFGSPSQAIFSPSGGEVLYRSAPGANGASPLNHKFGQGLPPGAQIVSAGNTGGKGKCNVYYYCCIFYCWSKWTPCGCYLVCADGEQSGTMIKADSPDAAGLTTNEFFDPPSATVSQELIPPSTPPTFDAAVPEHDRDRSDVPPDDSNYVDGAFVEESPPMMMMGGGGHDRKLSDDDERQSVLVTDSAPYIDTNNHQQEEPEPEPQAEHRRVPEQESEPEPEPEPEQQQNVDEEADPNDNQQPYEEEADPNEDAGAPEWDDGTTRPPYFGREEFDVPADEIEEDGYDNRPTDGPLLRLPDEPIVDEEEFEADADDGPVFDEQQLGEQDDETLIAFGHLTGRKPLLVHYPQSGVVFEARSGDRQHARRGTGGKDNNNKPDGKKKNDKKKQKSKEERKQQREQRKNERKRERIAKQQQQRNQADVDKKFSW